MSRLPPRICNLRGITECGISEQKQVPRKPGLLALMTGASLAASGQSGLAASPALATSPGDPRLAQIEQALQAQESRLNAQEKQLADQQKTLETQQAEIDRLRAEREGLLADIRAGRSDAGSAGDTAVPYASLSPDSAAPALLGRTPGTGAPAMTVAQVEPIRPDPASATRRRRAAAQEG